MSQTQRTQAMAGGKDRQAALAQELLKPKNYAYLPAMPHPTDLQPHLIVTS